MQAEINELKKKVERLTKESENGTLCMKILI